MIFDVPDDAWMARAKPLGPFVWDAAFRVADSLYIGPENGFSPQEWEAARVPLDPPDLPRRLHGYAVTLDLIGREAALVAFYERLIAAAEMHGKCAALAVPFPYFRITPTLLEAGEPVLSFPWTDDVAQTRVVLSALAEAGADGVVWDDIDQGWFMRIVRRDGALFIVEGEPDEDEPSVALRADASAVAAQAGAALRRLNAIHRHLTRACGQDFWTFSR